MTKIYLRSGQSATWLGAKYSIFICAAMLLGALFFAPASGAATAAPGVNTTPDSVKPGQSAKAEPMSFSDMAKQATQQSATAHRIEALPDGRARIPSPLQAMEATAAPEGITVVSTAKDKPGTFTIRAVSLGRAGNDVAPLLPGKVSVDGQLARITHPSLVEELTTSADGVRQDFVLPERPTGSGDLALDLAFDGAALAQKGEAIGLTLSQGRELLYHKLLVSDSAGKSLAAHFELLDTGHVRIVVADAGAIYPVRIDPVVADANWAVIPGTGPTGLSSYINALTWDGTNHTLYVGGGFTLAGGVANTTYIAKWDGSTWSSLGTGVNNVVQALAWDGTNLYAGGYFTTAGGVTVNRIAKWNSTSNTWSALGTGTNGTVFALAWDGTNHTLYAGGNFTTAGGVTVNLIAKWDGSTWSALGTGMSGNYINSLAWDGTNLYASGYFATAGGVTVNHIAKWNGNAWSALGTGMNNDVYALAWDGTNNNLYAGGKFTAAGGVLNTKYIAKWDGTTWSALGTGISSGSYVEVLAWDGTNLYVGGKFTNAGGVSASNIAKWNSASSWSALGTGVNNTVYGLAWDGTNLYAGGDLTTAGGVPANYIAKWYGGTNTWSALDTGIDNYITAQTWDGTNLYIGGGFTTAGGVANTKYIAKWDGTTWSALGTGMNGIVWTFARGGTNLYAGGEFTAAGGVANTKYIAKWDGSAWSALGTGTNDIVFALAWDGTTNNLYVGGQFNTAGGATNTMDIAKWHESTGGGDLSAWSALGTGINNAVWALAWDGTNHDLYAGGAFTTAGGNGANYIAKWHENGNNSAWSALGSGLNKYVDALAWDGTNTLYVGGDFTLAGGVTNTTHIAKWNGSAWSALGTGITGIYTGALAWDGTNLYVGGDFTTAGGVANTKCIAKWNSTTNVWSALGTGLNYKANALALVGTKLYAVGAFTLAGGSPGRVAYFPISHTVTASASTNGGTITPPTATVYHGETTTFTVTPNTGYSTVAVDTTCGGGALTGAAYTTGAIMADCSATASFTPNLHTLTLYTTGSGSVGGGGTFGFGTSNNVTAAANPGSTFTGWSGDCSGSATPTGVTMLDRDMTCTATFASVPTATTGSATGITTTGATLNGTESSNGASTTATFNYGLTTDYGSSVTATPNPLGPSASGSAISAEISGLTCNTPYHFRATGVNSAGTTNGSDATFLTSPCSPVISNLNGDPMSYLIGSGAKGIDQGTVASVTDSGLSNFNGGTLTVSITSNGTNKDQLGIRNQSDGANNITLTGSDVKYGGTTIGSFTGGANGVDLVVTFNVNADTGAVSALLRSITYANASLASIAQRTVRFTVTNGIGGTSNSADVTITLKRPGHHVLWG